MAERRPPRSFSESTVAEGDLERLRQELAGPLPHPDLALQRAYGLQTLESLLHHFDTLPEQAVGLTASRAEMDALLSEPAPELGQPFAKVLDDFWEKVAPRAFRTNHPRFLAFIPAAPTLFSVLGDWLCSGTNFFAGVWLEAAGPAEVELVVLAWFAVFLGYPAAARGLLTSGGSEANLTALVVARDQLRHEDRERVVLYVSEQRHWSVDRAARIIGLRTDQVRCVATDDDSRLSIPALIGAVASDRSAGRLPWVVAANAGATNTGAVDPLDALADFCGSEQLWLHVDAAYGWPAILDDEEKATLAGIDRADSIALDPHKWFAQTYEAGCLLIRQGQLLKQAFSLRPDYMQDVEPGEDEINFADHGLALTRRFRALKIWLSVKVLGVAWFRGLVRRGRRLAELAEVLLRQAGTFEILSHRCLSIVCFRYVPPAGAWGNPGNEGQLDVLNLALAEELRRSGKAFLSSTRLRNRVALRFCFVNWRTTAADVDEVVQLLVELGARLTR